MLCNRSSTMEFCVSSWSAPILLDQVSTVCFFVVLSSPFVPELPGAAEGKHACLGFETADSSLLIAILALKKNDSKDTWKSRPCRPREHKRWPWEQWSPFNLRVGNYLSLELWIEGPSCAVITSSCQSRPGRGSQEAIATRTGRWGLQEPTSCQRGSPRWPSFSTTSPDTALQSTTLITWWHTKQFWCKVELTEQRREGSAPRWAVWGIHSRWLQPSQPSRQSKPAFANKEGRFLFQDGRCRDSREWVEPVQNQSKSVIIVRQVDAACLFCSHTCPSCSCSSLSLPSLPPRLHPGLHLLGYCKSCVVSLKLVPSIYLVQNW